MKRIVKRTTTTEEWVDPGDEDQDLLDAADEDDTEQDDEVDESEGQDDSDRPPKRSKRRR